MKFEKNILDIYGEKGRQWLNNLPALIDSLAKQHELSDLIPVSNMSFNYVMKGVQRETPIILKCGLDTKALSNESLCLKAFENHAAPKVLVSADNLIIMECALPGSTLKHYFPQQEDEATRILCHLIQKLHSAHAPETHSFRHLSELLKTLDQDWNIPSKILSHAKELRDKLLSSTQREVLLHGDLHHDNILQNNQEWLAIDPKGFIGDPAFEPAVYIYNPIPELLEDPHYNQIIRARMKDCAQWLDFPEQRIRDWSYVMGVLSWAWSIEDNLDTSYNAHVIDILEGY